MAIDIFTDLLQHCALYNQSPFLITLCKVYTGLARGRTNNGYDHTTKHNCEVLYSIVLTPIVEMVVKCEKDETKMAFTQTNLLLALKVLVGWAVTVLWKIKDTDNQG